jgi:hypothetical protein
VVIKFKCNDKLAGVYASLIMLVLSMPTAAMYEWNVFPLQGNADNLARAYNGTVASGTINGSVYIDCGHGGDYLRPS